MKTKNKIRGLFAFLVVFALLMGNITINLAADDNQKGSIKLKYLENTVSDVHFALYKVADYQDNKFVGTGDFVNYDESISFNPKDQNEWNSLANTLKAYILRDNVSSLQDNYTNRQYEIDFINLDKGLYLIIGDSIKSGKKTYKSAPFFVILPYQDKDTVEYNVTVKPKYQTNEDNPGGGGGGGGGGGTTVKRKALKIWHNDKEKDRPEYIEVELLRDGKVYDTVKLTAENNWRYSWDNLSDRYDWLLVEKDVPKDYKVSFDRKGITFVITNTHDSTTPPPKKDNPPKREKPPEEDEIEEDDTPRSKTEKEEPKEEPTEEEDPQEEIEIEEEIPLSTLPFTGVVWWPVPVLFVAGLILLAIGFKKRVK